MISYLPESKLRPYNGKVSTGFEEVDDSPLVLARVIKSYTWSPIVWKGGHRLKANFLYSDYFALDFDKGPTIAEVLAEFRDTWHILATTRSHQKAKDTSPPCDRFRLIIKTVRRVSSCHEYEHNIRILARTYDSDPSCVDGARIMFPSPGIVSSIFEGSYPQPVLTPPTDAVRAAPGPQLGIMSGFLSTWLTAPIEVGERHGTAYKMGCHLERAGTTLDQAVDIALNNPTFATLPIDQKSDFARAVRNGYRKAREERERAGLGTSLWGIKVQRKNPG